MGFAMAEKILEAGHTLTVYNRTVEKARPLVDKGAVIAATPADTARNSEVVISILTDPNAVKEVSLGEKGIRSGLSENSVHCDMSTVSASWAEEIEQLYVMNSKHFIHAPVLGSLPQVKSASLLVFSGGKKKYQDILEPLFKSFSSNVWHFDSAKKAAIIKLSFNMLIAHMITGLGQSMVFLEKSGIEPKLFLEILEKSSLFAPLYKTKGEAILKRDFRANFYVKHLLKDLGLAQDAARETDIPLLWNAITREIFVSAQNSGYGDEDYSACIKVIEQMAGTQLKIHDENMEVF